MVSPLTVLRLAKRVLTVGRFIQPAVLSYIDQQATSDWPATSSYMVSISLSPGETTSASSFDLESKYSRGTHDDSWRLYYESNR